MLEDQHGVGILQRAQSMPRASSSVAGARILRPGMWAYQPSRLCECWAASCRPAPVAMRITSGTANCPPDMWRMVAALLTIWSSARQAEIHRHDLDDWAQAAHGRTDPGADEGRLRERRVANAFLAKFLQQPLGHRIAAAIAPNILTHQEGARIVPERLADRLLDRLTVGGLTPIVS